MQTKTSIGNDLASLGVSEGDGLFVHASLSAIGTVIGGARTVVEALIDQVGAEGLIAMSGFSTDAELPSLSNSSSADRLPPDRLRQAVLGFDSRTSSAAAMGAIAETFRNWPGTLRSRHPTISVCARGVDAAPLLAHHALAWATGPQTPFGAFIGRPNMKILLIGVGWNRCTALHTAETLTPNRRTKTREFKVVKGHRSRWIRTPDVADDLDRLFPLVGAAFEETGSVRIGSLGDAETRCCPYAGLVDFATVWLERAIAAGTGSKDGDCGSRGR